MALVDICFSCACVENIDRYWKGFKSKSYNSKILKPTENWLDMKKARESEYYDIFMNGHNKEAIGNFVNKGRTF